jgi:hypothetical protein
MLPKVRLFPKYIKYSTENSLSRQEKNDKILDSRNQVENPRLINGILYDGEIEETDTYIRYWTKDRMRGHIKSKVGFTPDRSDLLF